MRTKKMIPGFVVVAALPLPCPAAKGDLLPGGVAQGEAWRIVPAGGLAAVGLTREQAQERLCRDQ